MVATIFILLLGVPVLIGLMWLGFLIIRKTGKKWLADDAPAEGAVRENADAAPAVLADVVDQGAAGKLAERIITATSALEVEQDLMAAGIVQNQDILNALRDVMENPKDADSREVVDYIKQQAGDSEKEALSKRLPTATTPAEVDEALNTIPLDNFKAPTDAEENANKHRIAFFSKLLSWVMSSFPYPRPTLQLAPGLIYVMPDERSEVLKEIYAEGKWVALTKNGSIRKEFIIPEISGMNK